MPDPAPTLSVIIPVLDGGAAFQRCLAALGPRLGAGHELIVVDDGSRDASARWAAAAGARVLATSRAGSGPALARNLGAQAAGGAVLFFLDADIEIQPDTVSRIEAAFQLDPQLAALFGSYDDAPADPGFVSQYKNLMHHYIHQHANPQATTFWSGCGAIRAGLFRQLGGFSSSYAIPSIEDIELGSRLAARGGRIRLDPSLQVKHLKRWTLISLARSDIVARGIPWTRLILHNGRMPNDLNLQTASRLSVALVYLGLLAGLIGCFWPPAWAGLPVLAALLLWLNRAVYQFFRRRRGGPFAAGAVALHWLYYLYSGVALLLGVALFSRDRLLAGRAPLPGAG